MKEASSSNAHQRGQLLGRSSSSSPGLYVSYPQRWWILISVVLLNLSNYSHWVAFPSVSKSVAQYYDQSGEAIDLISTLSYGSGVPCCILATLAVEKVGLRGVLVFGASLTGLGGFLCFMSSASYLSEFLSPDEKYITALLGQLLSGIACPFISCVPTKISQHWFGDSERTLATILLGMSNPMGIVLGQGLTPQFVGGPQDVPLMNTIWFIPAAIGSIITILKVKSNIPPSPPSQSSEAQSVHRINYLSSLRQLTRNFPFLIMFLFLGAAMGYISTISTKIEQLLCSRGYSDQLSGLSGSLVLLCGFLASFAFGYLSHSRGGRALVSICKASGLAVNVFLALICYAFLQPAMPGLIILACGCLGIFSLGVYPLALELVVECTYPIDQAMPTALIFLSSSLQGVLLMAVENLMGGHLSPSEMEVQTCTEAGDEGHQRPKDYKAYLIFITLYMAFFVGIFILFFKTELRRRLADEERGAKRKEDEEEDPSRPQGGC